MATTKKKTKKASSHKSASSHEHKKTADDGAKTLMKDKVVETNPLGPSSTRSKGGIAVLIIAAFILGILVQPAVSGLFSGFGNVLGSDGLQVTVLTDDDCTDCDTAGFLATTKQLFPNATIETVDVDDRKGEKMVEKYDLTKIPSFIFEGELMQENAVKTNPNLASVFEEVNGAYKLVDSASGATTFIDEEKQEEYEAEQARLREEYVSNNKDVLGIEEGDKPRLDYFVMAFCPYGNPADEAAGQIYELLGNQVTIKPHYIVSTDGESIQSLHGEAEGNQGVRELCAQELFGYDEFFAFTVKANEMCNSQDVETCWKDAAQEAGLTQNEISQIESCHDSRRIDIAEEQDETISALQTMRQGQLVSPTASPTFLINGETYSGSRSPEALKDALCAEFDEDNRPAQCAEQLTEETAAAVGNC
jgi:hypothetical protein